MGWQGRVRKFAEVKRVADHFGLQWKDIEVWCWRDDRYYWVKLPPLESLIRLKRDTLEYDPLGVGG